MNLLVLGGTQFVGRHIVEAAVEAGHSVSVFTRGVSPDDLPPGVTRLRGDRDGGLDACGRVVDHRLPIERLRLTKAHRG